MQEVINSAVPVTNPGFDECKCQLAQEHRDGDNIEAAQFHAALLALDGPGALTALATVLVHLTGFELPSGYEPELFMAEHRWTDQVAAVWVGQALEEIRQLTKS